jgi:hypothetical protein
MLMFGTDTGSPFLASPDLTIPPTLDGEARAGG